MVVLETNVVERSNLDDLIKEKIEDFISSNNFEKEERVRKTLARWLYDIIEVFDSKEYTPLYGQGIPLTSGTFDKIKDGKLRFKVLKTLMNQLSTKQGLGLLGIKDQAFQLLQQIRSDIYEAYKQSQQLNLSELLQMSSLDSAKSIDRKILDVTENLYEAEPNYFRRKLKKRLTQEWLQNITDVFDSREYQQLYEKGIPLTSNTHTKINGEELKSKTQKILHTQLLDNEGLNLLGIKDQAFQLLQQIRSDIYEAYKQSKGLSSSEFMHIGHLEREKSIDQKILGVTEDVYEDEPNYFRRKLKKRLTQEWLQNITDVFDSREYQQLYEKGVPLNTTIHKRLQNKELKSKTQKTLHTQLVCDGGLYLLGIKDQAFQLLQQIRSDIYEAYKQSQQLNLSELLQMRSTDSTKSIDQKILGVTEDVYEDEPNYFRRKLKKRLTQEWLQNITDVFDSIEYQQLYEKGIPFTKTIYRKIQNEDLKSKVLRILSHQLVNNQGLNLLGIKDRAFQLLRQIRPDIYEAYKQSQELTLSESIQIGYLEREKSIDQKILGVTEDVYEDEPNYFRRKLKKRLTQEWLQNITDVFDSREYQQLYEKGVPLNTTIHKRLQNKELRLKTQKILCYQLDSNQGLGILGIKDQTFQLLREIRPDIYQACEFRINNKSEDIPKIHGKYAQEISKLRKELIDLKSQNSKYPHNAVGPFSGFGKCYENFVGILLALEHPRIEHQIKLDSSDNGSFRVADFGTFDNGRKGYLTLEDLESFFEVKSGISISEHDKEQLRSFLTQNKDLVYILHDKNSNLAQRLKEISPDLDIRTHSDLKSHEIIRNSDICSLFDDKANFSSYKSTNAISRLERDLFSVYLYIKNRRGKGENIAEEVVHKLLEGVYLQNDETTVQLSEEYSINWLEKIEYDRMKSIYLDGNSGRRYIDPRIVIVRLGKEIEREKKKAKEIEIKQLPKLKIKELYEKLRCWRIPLDDFYEQITNLSPEIYSKLIERAEANKKIKTEFSLSPYIYQDKLFYTNLS